jgi:hypothetical protein
MTYQPTALLVMKHNVTGMKYFCKTSRLDNIAKYKGSGVYWKQHLRKHGKDVSVGLLGVYYDEVRCKNAALEFSLANNIVASDGWANLIHENGFDGAPTGEHHPLYGKPSPSLGQKRPWVGKHGKDNPMWGKVSAMRGIPKPKGVDSPLFGRKRPEGGGKPARKIICITDNKEFESVSAAAQYVNGSVSTISRCCLGKRKTAYGKTWKYKESV